MKNTSLSSDVSNFYSHLIAISQEARSTWIPMTDVFGIKTYLRCLDCCEKTFKDRMKRAGVDPVPDIPVSEILYHARDVSRAFIPRE